MRAAAPPHSGRATPAVSLLSASAPSTLTNPLHHDGWSLTVAVGAATE